jgi:hypothetical protein
MNTDINVQRLEHMLHTWLAAPNDDNVGQVPLVRALVENGVTRWSHFVLLTMDQVHTLSCMTPHNQDPLQIPIAQMNLVMVALFLHHRGSRKIGRKLDPLSVRRVDFDTFHKGIYDTQTPMIHWGMPIPDIHTHDVTSWKRVVKPRTKDFAPFWNEAYWSQGKQRSLTTVAALGLNHLID